jgi:cysteine-rich repeat protein
VCDDGSITDTINCKSDCTGSELGYFCAGGDFNNPSVCQEVCGDGILTIGEGCEDGNAPPVSLDGCSNGCQVESGWTCSGTTNQNCIGICGDGKLKAREICDDGNTADN